MTLRSLVLGIVSVLLACLVVAYAELVLTYIQIGILQFPPVVIGLFFILALINRFFRKRCQRWGLTPAELAVVYLMTLLGTMVASRGLMEKLLPLLVTPDYFANETNGWQRLFFPHIPSGIVPFNPAQPARQWISLRFFEGLRAGEPMPWLQWLRPLALWGLLVAGVYFTFFCLATLLRRHWTDYERLTFPLTSLPLELMREETCETFLRNPFTWLGVAIPAFVFGMNGLHGWFPAVPFIPLSYDIHSWFVNPPWNGMFYTPAFVSFAAVGFFYLLPADLLFGLWFFFLMTRLEDVVATALGNVPDNMPLYPTRFYIGYQVMGAYAILVGYLLYSSRFHLKRVWEAVWHPQVEDNSTEMVSYRFAVIGLILGFTFTVSWAFFAGLSLWVALGAFAIYFFFVALVMARSTSESGLLMTETSFRPVDVARLFVPTHTLGAQNLTLLAFLDSAFFRDQRGLVLTGFLDGLKLSDGVRLSRKSVRWAILIALVTAFLSAGAIELWLPYHRGGVTMYSYVYRGNNLWAFQDYAPALAGPVPHDWRGPVFFVVGAGIALVLSLLRSRFFWWPLHPLGYALSASWTMIVFWFPCLLAWLIKGLILRYGGMRLFVRLRPFFLGMVLGEFGMAVLWTLLSWWFDAPAPFFPWP